MRPKGEAGSYQENEPAQPEQSRRPEQGKQRDWIGEKTKSERIYFRPEGAVARLVGIEGGVVSGVTNLESSGVEASDWRPRHDERYHEA